MKPTGDTRHSDQVAPSPVFNGHDLKSTALPPIPSPSSVDTSGAVPNAIARVLRDYASIAVKEIVDHVFYNRCSGRNDVAFEVFTTLSDSALARVGRFEGKRTPDPRVQDLILGLYVAEPDGIWTPIGTVSEFRLSSYRRGGPMPFNKDQFHKALEKLHVTQLIELLDITLSQSRLLNRVLIPFIKRERAAVPLRMAARARHEQNNK